MVLLVVDEGQTKMLQRALGNGLVRTEGTHYGIRVAIDSKTQINIADVTEHIDNHIGYWVNREGYVIDWPFEELA